MDDYEIVVVWDGTPQRPWGRQLFAVEEQRIDARTLPPPVKRPPGRPLVPAADQRVPADAWLEQL